MNIYQSVAIGVAAYWVVGIFAKGIFEPIQAKLGQELFRILHRKTEELDRRVAATRNQIDDLIVEHLREASASLNSIVNPADLLDGDRRCFHEKLNESYSVSALTEKALDKFPIDF